MSFGTADTEYVDSTTTYVCMLLLGSNKYLNFVPHIRYLAGYKPRSRIVIHRRSGAVGDIMGKKVYPLSRDNKKISTYRVLILYDIGT